VGPARRTSAAAGQRAHRNRRACRDNRRRRDSVLDSVANARAAVSMRMRASDADCVSAVHTASRGLGKVTVQNDHVVLVQHGFSRPVERRRQTSRPCLVRNPSAM